MSTKLIIKNLKNIASLEFEIPPPGAYLLTGSNGSGKTSLLTCLSRLRNSAAFQRGFRSSSHQSLDSHRGASVRYEIDGKAVTYTYVEERWAPLPRKNSGLLATAGFPEVIYIAADSSRVEPQQQEFAPRRVKLTPQPLRDSMNTIFSTDRFSELCCINLNRGGRTKAYLIRKTEGKSSTYFSERNFSLGELCVLKLLLALENVSNNSLVLIDELELAVHPRAQTQMFHYLTKFATEKNLTIIFSTHSVTLIKGTDRRKVLFLQNLGGTIRCITGCYPTFALGHISSGEEVAPDCVVYVEDDSAKKCVSSMIDLYRRTVSTDVALPTATTVPLGGFRQILEFLDKAPQMLPPHTKLIAALDADVEKESLVKYKANDDHAMLGLFDRLQGKLAYLPWTPEVGFVQLIQMDRAMHEGGLKDYFADHRVMIPHSWGENTHGLTGKSLRTACKKAFYELGHKIEGLIGKSNDRVREDMFAYLVRESQTRKLYDVVGFVAGLIHNKQ